MKLEHKEYLKYYCESIQFDWKQYLRYEYDKYLKCHYDTNKAVEHVMKLVESVVYEHLNKVELNKAYQMAKRYNIFCKSYDIYRFIISCLISDEVWFFIK
jgi:hypothetical protein